ncbi:MAG: tetratricopeptide repeat protein [Schleiferiaceae bacterium]
MWSQVAEDPTHDTLAEPTVQERFYGFLGSEHPDSALYFLNLWKQEDSTDAEFYIATFNYYFSIAEREVMILDKNVPNAEDALILTDDSGNVAGSMYSVIQYDDELVDKGIAAVSEGIEKYPNRLDMYLGRIYVLGKAERKDQQVQKILELIELNYKDPKGWMWSEGEVIEDTALVFGAIQDYLYDYFTSDPPDLETIETINTKLVERYPTHPEFASNEGVIEIYRGNIEAAIVKFKRAESLAPNDGIILGNLGYCYLELGENDKAKEIYTKLLEVGNEEEREIAQDYLKTLEETP